MLWLLNYPRRNGAGFCRTAVVGEIGCLLDNSKVCNNLIAQKRTRVYIWNAICFSSQPRASTSFLVFLYWWLMRHSLPWITKITNWAGNYSSWNITGKKWGKGHGRVETAVWSSLAKCQDLLWWNSNGFLFWSNYQCKNSNKWQNGLSGFCIPCVASWIRAGLMREGSWG